MKKALTIALCVLIPTAAFAADAWYKVVYDGRSLPDVKSGSGMRLVFDSKQLGLVYGKADPVSIPPASITEISYGQDVHRRVGAAIGLAVVSFGIGALMALTKSKKHFIGLTGDTSDEIGRA